MTSCYLTIDDSPSIHTGRMIDFLKDRKIPALLFIRGDLCASNPDPIVGAIEQGFVIGNHSYAHKPYGDLSYEEAINDIEKCEIEIEKVYNVANIKRSGKYFRFPYLDRGNGDRIERHFESVSNIDINADEKVQRIQDYLNDQGYVQPFETNHPLYTNQSIANAADCLMTFTSYDWMLTSRHIGKWDYKNTDDLKKRIDGDRALKSSNGNVLIYHDQSETFDTFKSLIDHMLDSGYEFLTYHNQK